jgi:hypothetical protein
MHAYHTTRYTQWLFYPVFVDANHRKIDLILPSKIINFETLLMLYRCGIANIHLGMLTKASHPTRTADRCFHSL